MRVTSSAGRPAAEKTNLKSGEFTALIKPSSKGDTGSAAGWASVVRGVPGRGSGRGVWRRSCVPADGFSVRFDSSLPVATVAGAGRGLLDAWLPDKLVRLVRCMTASLFAQLAEEGRADPSGGRMTAGSSLLGWRRMGCDNGTAEERATCGGIEGPGPPGAVGFDR